jgi:hypothetical protein
VKVRRQPWHRKRCVVDGRRPSFFTAAQEQWEHGGIAVGMALTALPTAQQPPAHLKFANSSRLTRLQRSTLDRERRCGGGSHSPSSRPCYWHV